MSWGQKSVARGFCAVGITALPQELTPNVLCNSLLSRPVLSRPHITEGLVGGRRSWGTGAQGIRSPTANGVGRVQWILSPWLELKFQILLSGSGPSWCPRAHTHGCGFSLHFWSVFFKTMPLNIFWNALSLLHFETEWGKLSICSPWDSTALSHDTV